MTQNELIAYYKNNLINAIASHGVDSSYVNYAFYQLQASKMTDPSPQKICEFATREMERLHELALESVEL